MERNSAVVARSHDGCSGVRAVRHAPIKLANVAELSGGGASIGANWKNGIDLAMRESTPRAASWRSPRQKSANPTQQ